MHIMYYATCISVCCIVNSYLLLPEAKYNAWHSEAFKVLVLLPLVHCKAVLNRAGLVLLEKSSLIVHSTYTVHLGYHSICIHLWGSTIVWAGLVVKTIGVNCLVCKLLHYNSRTLKVVIKPCHCNVHCICIGISSSPSSPVAIRLNF